MTLKRREKQPPKRKASQNSKTTEPSKKRLKDNTTQRKDIQSTSQVQSHAHHRTLKKHKKKKLVKLFHDGHVSSKDHPSRTIIEAQLINIKSNSMDPSIISKNARNIQLHLFPLLSQKRHYFKSLKVVIIHISLDNAYFPGKNKELARNLFDELALLPNLKELEYILLVCTKHFDEIYDAQEEKENESDENKILLQLPVFSSIAEFQVPNPENKPFATLNSFKFQCRVSPPKYGAEIFLFFPSVRSKKSAVASQ